MKNAVEVDASPQAIKSRSALLTFGALAVLVLVLDQATKWWALRTLGSGHIIPVLGERLRFVLVFNPGAAFGTGANATIALTIVAVIVSIVIVFMARRLGDGLWAATLGLFLGGAVGNLGDRLFREPGFGRGHVVDFIDYGGLFVGNVADIALTFAAIMVLYRAWTGVKLDGTRDKE